MTKLYSALIGIYLLVSCGQLPEKDIEGINSKVSIHQKSKKAALDLCNCLEAKIGSDLVIDTEFLKEMNSHQKMAEACLSELAQNNFDGLSAQEKKKFFKEVLHAFIESPCIEKLLDRFPFMFLEQFLL